MALKRFGKVLKRLRQEKGLTQAALAERAKVHKIYVAQLEAGTKSNPSAAVVKRLAVALGVPMEELVK